MKLNIRLFAKSLKHIRIDSPHLEITSMADIPAGTGLGSSGSFTTALLKALHTLKKESDSSERIGRRSLSY